MASLEEYVAVHGQEPPAGKTAATEFGDGGCHVIFKGKGYVVGRWISPEDARMALERLKKLPDRFEYRLEDSHHWVSNLYGTHKCSKCNTVKTSTLTYRQADWP